jgi:hypothetical protein
MRRRLPNRVRRNLEQQLIPLVVVLSQVKGDRHATRRTRQRGRGLPLILERRQREHSAFA